MTPFSILIVDDNEIALKEMKNILEYLNFDNIHETQSTNEAWSMMRMLHFDCVISSWDMPEMSGLAFLKVMRGDDRFHEIPFFLTHSSFTKVKVVQAGMAAVTGLVVRPFSVDNINHKMKSLASVAEENEFIDEEKIFSDGNQLLESGNYEEALVVFEKLTESDKNAEYYYNVGYIKTSQEKYGEAIVAFRQATQLDRMYAKAFEAMGRAYKQLGDQENAEKCMQKAADIYLNSEKIQNAEDVLNEILEINPDTLNVYNSLGVISRKKGDLKQALKYYHKALLVHKKEPYIHYNIGRLCLDMGDRTEAEKHFKIAVQIKPDFKEAAEVLEAFKLGSI